MRKDRRFEVFLHFDTVMLRYNISTVALDLINYDIDVANEKSLCKLLLINVKSVHGLVQIVLCVR
jgi:hypothetical protein